MRTFDIRWKNFRGFRDTKRISIRPITIIVGANASGKTSLLAPLLMLKQTLEASDSELALKTVGKYFNAGSFENLIFNHDKSSKLSFEIFFSSQKRGQEGKLKRIGAYPPAEVALEFAYSNEKDTTILSKYTVRDEYGRVMLTHRKKKSGTYSVRGGIFEGCKQNSLKEIQKSAMPNRFLFSEKRIVHAKIKRLQKGTEKKNIALHFSKHEHAYLSTITYVAARITQIFNEISYIGPLSEAPHRIYDLLGEKPLDVGKNGENAPEILYREKKSTFLENINRWVEAFEFGSHINCESLSNKEGIFSVTLSKGENSPHVNIADTGFGLSQVLPLIVQGFYAKKNSLIIAEQPEVHLNPRLQAMLADLFIDIIERGVGILVETHSEHLLLRLRRLIAEGKVDSKNVALYFVEPKQNQSKVREIPIDKSGHIDIDDWPNGFFEEPLFEALALANAQAQRKKRS